MNRNPFARFSLLPFAFMLLLAACDSTEPEAGGGEEEFFTEVTITLSGDDGSTATATASDPDGDKANIVFTTLMLKPGVTYTGALTLRDDINDEDVTGEIEEEAEAHLFFYTPEGGVTSRLTVTRLDTDANDAPLGLEIRVAVSPGGAATGTLNVKLAHYENEDDKQAAHTPANRPGSELDLDLDFPVTLN